MSSSGIRRIRTQGKFVDRERFETICKKFSGFDNSRSGASDWIFDSEKKTQEVKKINNSITHGRIKNCPASAMEQRGCTMKKNWKYSLMLIVTVLTVSMGVFFLLYRFDNKYTAKGDQPIQGILYVPMMIRFIIWPESGNIIRMYC